MKNEEIGNRIRQLRHEQHITQIQIYKACGISSGNLSSIETGKTLPSSAALMQLSRILNCITDYILFGEEKKCALPSAPSSTVQPLTGQAKEMLCLYQTLSPRDQEELLMLARWKSSHDLCVSKK